jgi:hypothetical protein
VAARTGQGLASWRHCHHASDARLVTVAPPPQVDPASGGALSVNLEAAVCGGWPGATTEQPAPDRSRPRRSRGVNPVDVASHRDGARRPVPPLAEER